MRQFFSSRGWVLIFSLLALLTLLALAAELRDVNFLPGQPLSSGETQSIQTSVEGLVESLASETSWRQAVFWILAFFLLLFIFSLLSPEARKRALRMLIRFAFFAWAIFFLVKNRTLLGILAPFGEGLGGDSSPSAESIGPPPAFTPPDIPDGWMYWISLAVLLGLLALVRILGRRLRPLLFRTPERVPLDELAAAARASLDDLSAGRDWDDVVMSCYVRMNEAVNRKRGLLRADDMTPAEFAARLEGAGLPADPVRRLTRLFESARYGARRATTRETDEAVSCLTAILHFCGEAA
ncbi:MAG: DUF4129 domain-containing protein [Chloroflexota bacterium]